jgi:hypothetical protein
MTSPVTVPIACTRLVVRVPLLATKTTCAIATSLVIVATVSTTLAVVRALVVKRMKTAHFQKIVAVRLRVVLGPASSTPIRT